MTSDEFTSTAFSADTKVKDLYGFSGRVTLVDFTRGYIHYVDDNKRSHYGKHYSQLTIINMKYYEIYHSEKSHSDYPAPMFRDIFFAKDDEDYQKKLKSYTEHSEDWNVHEISKAKYDTEMEYYREDM